MESGIKESDWKLFRQLRPVALERFCQRALAEVGHLVTDAEFGAHQRYLAIYALILRRNKELEAAFDSPRRSVAWRQLAIIRSHGLLSEEEFAGFSPETQRAVQGWLEM